MESAEALAARLRDNPADADAYERLKAAYRQRGDHASLANLLSGWASWTPDAEGASRALAEVGDLLSQHLGDLEQAEAHYLEALRRYPYNTDASEALQTLWERQGDYHKLTNFLQEQLQSLTDLGVAASELAALRYRLGQLWSTHFDAPDEALHHFRRALDLDPSLARAAYDARQICQAAGDYRAACELFDREVAAETDPQRKSQLLLELAGVYRDQLGDLDGAVAALQRSRASAPGDIDAAYELATLLAQRAEGLDPRTARGDYEQVADLLCEIAGALPPGEAQSYLESALGYAPQHEQALSELERLVEGGPEHATLAARWVAYLATGASGRAADRRRVKLARAYSSLDQIEDAIYCLQPAVDAGHGGAAELLEELRHQLPELDDPELLKSDPAPSDAPPHAISEPPFGATRSTVELRPVSRRRSAELLMRSREKPELEHPELDEDRSARATHAGPRPRKAAPLSEPPASEPPASEPPAPEPPASGPPRTELPGATDTRATADLGTGQRVSDEKDHTQVGEVGLIESLREASGTRPDAVIESARPSAQELADDLEAWGQRQSEPASSAPSTRPPPADRERTVAAPSPVADIDRTVSAPSPLGSAEELRRMAGECARERRQDEAADLYRQLIALDPGDREAFAYLDSHFRRRQAHRERAELLLRSADNSELPLRTRLTRLREAASVFEARLKDVDGAVAAWTTFQQLEPDGNDAPRAIKRLLERAGRWDELTVVLEDEAERATSAEAKLPMLRRLATLHRDKRGDRTAAAAALSELVALKPDDRAARDTLLEDLLELGRADEAVPLLEERVKEARGKAQQLPLLMQIAELHDRQLQDPDAAYASYERVLKITPRDMDVLAHMARLDEQSHNFERLLSTLDRQAVAIGGPEAAPIFARMAEIAERELSDVERATGLLAQAADLAPENGQYLQSLCALYEREDRYEDLIEVLRERSIVEKQPEAKIELYRRIAHLQQERLGELEDAVVTWNQVLSIREDREALEALQQRALELDDPEQLADVLGRLAGLEHEMEERRDLLYDRARLLRTRLGRPEEAIVELVTILSEIDPEFDPALDELAAACDAADDQRGLAEVLEARMGTTRDLEQRLEHARRLSDLYEGSLDDPARAIRALHKWAEYEPDEAEPHRRLLPHLKKKRRFKELLSALDALTRLDLDDTDRADAAIEAATLAHENFGDVDGAWQRLEGWAEAGDERAEKALGQLAAKSGRYDAFYGLLERTDRVDTLLELLRQRVEEENDDATRADLYRRIAILLIEHDQDEDGAAAAYEKLLEIREDVDALRFVQSVALRRDDPARLASVLKRLAAIETDPLEQRDLLYEHARLLNTRLSDAPGAIAVLQQLTSQHPDYEPAIDELLSASQSAGDHGTLADTLERLLQNATELLTRAELAARLADVCEFDLEDPKRASRALTAWSEADVQNPEPLRRLRPLLEAGNKHRELLACLDALSELEPDPTQRIEATIAAARLSAGPLKDRDGAWERMLPLLSEGDEEADALLHQLAQQGGRLEELYTMLGETGRHARLIDLLRERVTEEKDEGTKVELYRRIARTTANELDDEEGAAAAWSELLDVREDHEALHFLRSRAVRRDDMDVLAGSLKRLVALEENAEEKRDLLYEYARLLNTRLLQHAEAIPLLCQILDQLDADFEPAIDELVSASESAGDDRTLASALERVLARETDGESRIELLQRLADLYSESLDDDTKAVSALERWVELEPDALEPRHRLVPLLTDAGRHRDLLIQLEAIIGREPDEALRDDARLSAAKLALDQLDNPDAAFAHAAPLLQAGDERATALLTRLAFEHSKLDDLAELYTAAERFDELIVLLRDRAEETDNRSLRAELFRRCARILGGPLGDELAAAEAWREVLEAGEDAEALQFLRGIATRMDDPEELADLLGRLANRLEDDTEKRDVLFERALLLGDRLQRQKETIEVLRYIVDDLDPEFAPAIEELIVACETAEDHKGLAFALERQLLITADLAVQAEIAERLSDLYEDVLDDATRAAEALLAWSQADPGNPAPLRRLRPHLDKARRYEELVATLDALATYEESEEARTEAAFASAHVTFNRLGDTEGAWTRLAPLVMAGDERAELEAYELAKRAELQRPLANLYVMRAQQAKQGSEASRDWMKAARVYDELLDQPAEALEAALRALAADMENRSLLYDIDRLALAAGAGERLWRVYGRLVQAAKTREAKIELLERHANLLEKLSNDPSAALERVLEICKLDPERVEFLERAEALATRADSNSELLWIYEHLYRSSTDAEHKAKYLLRAARISDLGLQDREQAMLNMARALALTEDHPQIAAQIEDLARELDKTRPELGRDDARRTLVRAHMDLAPKCGEPYGPMLVLRASQLLHNELGDDAGCFDALKQGAATFPNDLDIYDALEKAALRIKRLDALDAHLSRCLQRATDQDVRLLLLERRGRLNATHLGRPAKAAEVYRDLLDIDPDDTEASEAYFASLKAAGRYQQLVRAYQERLDRADENDKPSLLRRIASLWEVELKNRPSAIETWKEVLALVPDDSEATQALSRLQ
ncbi:MAG: hypothetical protein OEZ06_23815 [Myxococcales bacterium]|nr:hypothetical protein [Myxococcales bacterium]